MSNQAFFLCTFTAHAGSRLSHKPEFWAHGPEFFRRWPWVFLHLTWVFFPVDLSFFGGHLQDQFYCIIADFRDKIQNFLLLCVSRFLFSPETSPQKRLPSGTCFFSTGITELEIYETLSFLWKYLSFFATLSFFRTWVFFWKCPKKPWQRPERFAKSNLNYCFTTLLRCFEENTAIDCINMLLNALFSSEWRKNLKVVVHRKYSQPNHTPSTPSP